jgi:hypothetical protein
MISGIASFPKIAMGTENTITKSGRFHRETNSDASLNAFKVVKYLVAQSSSHVELLSNPHNT